MATQAQRMQAPPTESGHRWRWRTAAVVGGALVAAIGAYGLSYYLTPMEARPHHPLHWMLRPNGIIGLKLGILAAALFLVVYLYPLRKRWRWLQRFGKTRQWLDFHILFGLLAPAVITLHSSFKFRGIAGMAYWIMWAVVASGIVGRYLFRQIPRSLSAAELSLDEMERSQREMETKLRQQSILSPEDIETVFRIPDSDLVDEMPLGAALLSMMKVDLMRPFEIARLRRSVLSWPRAIVAAGGLLPFGPPELEEVIDVVRRRCWLATKIVFLGKTQSIFHLWHVVHRPFSYSFIALVVLHVGFALLLGYF